MTSIRLTEDDCRNVTWQLVEQTPEYRRYIGHGTHPVTGAEITVQKTEALVEESLLRANHEERMEADARPWSYGMGSEKGGNMPLVKVASIPLNKFYADVVPHLKEGDDDHARWYLNRDEALPFRTRSGKV